MTSLLLCLLNLAIPVNTIALQASEGPAAPDTIGFIVLAIIVGPVFLLIIAAIFGTPRTFRVPGLFLGSLVLLVAVIILSFAAVGALLRFIVPQ